MFEKEAEEYADKDFGMYEPTDHERYAKETDWRNGAEFGYNKANKWHYVKDGDLPKEGDFIVSDLLILIVRLKGTNTKSYKFGRYNFGTDMWEYSYLSGIEEVIAWKEIVPPVAKEANK